MSMANHDFHLLPNVGVMTDGQPVPSGLVTGVLLGHLGALDMTEDKSTHERLRRDAEYIDFDEYSVPDEARKSFYIAMGEYIRGGLHGLWLDPQTRDGHADPAELMYRIGTRFYELTETFNGNLVTSPIEHMMLGAMVWMDVDWAGMPVVDHSHFHFDERKENDRDGLKFIITPQAPIGSYKADFLVWFQFGREHAGIVIECDGHAFHERTKEQAARDKKRDRDILASGYPVLRFSGSEIYKDTMACVEQAKEIAVTVLYDFSKKVGLI